MDEYKNPYFIEKTKTGRIAVYIRFPKCEERFFDTEKEAEKWVKRFMKDKRNRFRKYRTGSYYGSVDWSSSSVEIRVSDHKSAVKSSDFQRGYVVDDYIEEEIEGIHFLRNEDWTDFVFPQKNALRLFLKIEDEIKKRAEKKEMGYCPEGHKGDENGNDR